MARKIKQRLNEQAGFKNQLNAIEECETMIHYAQNQGLTIPGHVLKMLSDIKAIQKDLEAEVLAGNAEQLDPRSLNIAVIGEIHNELAAVIAPASPATVLMLENSKSKGLNGLLGQVPLVRRLSSITIICLLTFLGLFFAPEVTSRSINGDILSYDPRAFVLNELVIVAIAALGSAFYALFEAHKYISKNSYDSKYDSIYWIRFILGIVSGVILSQFIFVSPEILGNDSGETVSNINASRELGGFITYKPLLAFLGGFSARVVHKILNSLVDAIETFISGSARDMVKAREAAARVQMDEKINALRQKNAQTDAMERMKTTMKLMEMQQQINTTADTSNVQQQLNQMMNDIMGPVNGIDVNFNSPTPGTTNPTAFNSNPSFDNPTEDYVPIVDEYSDTPIISDDFPDVEIGDDVDHIDIPDFPQNLDNPDFPMPGDLKDDFDPTKVDAS